MRKDLKPNCAECWEIIRKVNICLQKKFSTTRVTNPSFLCYKIWGVFQKCLRPQNWELSNIHISTNETSFNVWVRNFVWYFKGSLWNSRQNILPMHWNTWFKYNVENSRALRLTSLYVFLKCPLLLQFSLPMLSLYSWVHTQLCASHHRNKHANHRVLANVSRVFWCDLGLRERCPTCQSSGLEAVPFCMDFYIAWKVPGRLLAVIGLGS